MKAVIYARQSSGNDDVSESVEAQITNCRRLAAKENLEIIGIFKDLNSSGETYPAGAENVAEIDQAYQEWLKSQSSKKTYRRGLGDLLAMLNNADIILVNEHTRLYRPINGSFLEGHINYQLKKSNIKLMQVQGGSIDLAKFDQQLITSIKNQILYDDLQKKRQNSINAFRLKKDSGKLCCGTKAFGLRYLGNDKIEVKKECIKIIRFIYDSICEYKTYSSIIKACNTLFAKENIFYPSTIFNIAKQPLYAGMQYNTRGELIKNLQMQGQAIISLPQWSKVQSIINNKRRSYPARTKKHWLPLSGKIFCGSCGKHLVCSLDKGKIYYICSRCNFLPSNTGCRNSRIRFETGAYGKPALRDVILPLLSIALQERERKLLLQDENILKLDQYNSELEKLKKMEQKIYNIYLEGVMSTEQMQEILTLYNQKRANLSHSIFHLQSQTLITAEGYQHSNNIFPEILKKIRHDKLDNHIYQTLLEESAIKITVWKDFILINTLYGNLQLPRLWHNGKCSMPEWQIVNYHRNNTAANGKPSFFGKLVITYETGHKSVIADFGKLVIKSK